MIAYGKTSLNAVIPLLLDVNGNVIVSADQLTTTGGKLKVDANGRLEVVPYSVNAVNYDSILHEVSNITLPAGTSNQLDSAVPANQAYILKNVHVLYTGTVAGVKLRIVVQRSSTLYHIGSVDPVVSLQQYNFVYDFPLIAGDQAGIRVVGATLNDDLNSYLAYQRVY